MHRLILLAAVVGIAACSGKPPAVVPTPAARFEFSVESDPDSVRGRFVGSATLEAGWFRVEVNESQITLPPGRPENWRALTVRAFLATDYQRGWKAVAQARPVNVFRFLDFSKASNTQPRSLKVEQPLTFMVPVPPGTNLADARLAFELEWIFVYGGYGEAESRLAFTGPIPAAPIAR